jgi:anti-anti-sigma regulatory factor
MFPDGVRNITSPGGPAAAIVSEEKANRIAPPRTSLIGWNGIKRFVALIFATVLRSKAVAPEPQKHPKRMFARHPLVTITTFVDPFDEDDVGQVLHLLLKHVKFGRKLHVIDLDRLWGITSFVLRALGIGVRMVRQYDGDVNVVASRPCILRGLELSGFDEVVEVYPSAFEAVMAFRQQPRKAG